MIKYIFKRVGRSLLTLLLIIAAVFVLLRKMPIEGYFNNYEKMTPTQVRVGLANLGLDKPIPAQFTAFLKNMLKGDLGLSHKYRVNYPISSLIADKMPLSLKIGLMAMILGLFVGLSLGVLMARSARSKARIKLLDRAGTVIVVLVQAIPSAVYYLFIQIYGTELLGMFFPLPTLFVRENLLTWVLPVFSLSLGTMAWSAMWIRRYMVDDSTKDYVQLARAKGVSAGKISMHIFRNAFVPLTQGIPIMVLVTLMGSLYVESRYSIPGMGGLLVDVIKRQDNTVVQALVVIYSAVSILGLLIGDIVMALQDPRISLAKGGETR